MITGWRGALGTTAEVGNDHSLGRRRLQGPRRSARPTSEPARSNTSMPPTSTTARSMSSTTRSPIQTWAGAFTDPKLPKGYAPFGIQNLNGMIFVTYAKTQPGSDDEAHGHGRGVVDAFATNGMFLGRVASHGALNAPWGLAWAPADFGRFSNDLLVGNFGDGRINRLPLGRPASGTRTVS